MGSDFCAEHEWGVDSLRRSLGCDSTKDGIDRRQMTTVPNSLRLVEGVAGHPSDKRKKGTPYEGMFLSPLESFYRQPAGFVEEDLRPYGDQTLCCAWDEKSFGIVAYGEKDKKNIKILWEAFQRKDVAFWPNIGAFHLGGGLIFCIASKVPEEDKKNMYAADLDHKELLKESAAIGIEEELKKAGKGFMALTPRWAKQGFHGSTNDKDATTTYKVSYWLNPMDQERNNWGWVTVEELKLWAEGKGPLVKTEAQRRARSR